MILFKDIISGDELFTDIYPIKDVKDAPGLVMVEGKITSETSAIADSLIGGNKSAEDCCEDEGVSDQGDKMCNIVRCSKLEEMSKMDKTLMKLWAKKFCKAVREKLIESGNKDKADKFQSQASGCLKFLLGKVKDLDVYCGENMDPNGSLGFLDFKEDGITPIMYFFRDALIEEKV